MLGSVAALKVCKGSNPATRRRFADEALLFANVHHPHLVAVLMTGKTEYGAPYMVLEYLPGCSLDERLRDGGPIPWREAVQPSRVARALEVLHVRLRATRRRMTSRGRGEPRARGDAGHVFNAIENGPTCPGSAPVRGRSLARGSKETTLPRLPAFLSLLP